MMRATLDLLLQDSLAIQARGGCGCTRAPPVAAPADADTRHGRLAAIPCFYADEPPKTEACLLPAVACRPMCRDMQPGWF